MTLDDVFSRPYYRRIAVVLMVFVILLLLVSRYFILPFFSPNLQLSFPQFFAKFLEDLSAALIGTLFLAVCVMVLTPPTQSSAKVEVLEASQLKREFSSALNQSDFWWFYGGCGRYFRSAVVSAMGKRASAEGTKTLRAIILNPTNTVLCEQHANYRAATSRGIQDGQWTASRVKCELLATIVYCLKASQKNTLLKIELSISDRFSTFRADISSISAIETREDPKAPALKSPADSDFYKALKTEFDILAQQSSSVLDSGRKCLLVTDLTTLKQAVSSLMLPGLVVTAAEYLVILGLVKDPVNPHG